MIRHAYVFAIIAAAAAIFAADDFRHASHYATLLMLR